MPDDELTIRIHSDVHDEKTRALLQSVCNAALAARSPQALVEALGREELEALTKGYPETASDPLIACTIAYLQLKTGKKTIEEDAVVDCLPECALHLSIELLQRYGLIAYELHLDGRLSVEVKEISLTQESLRELIRDEKLREFADGLLRNVRPEASA